MLSLELLAAVALATAMLAHVVMPLRYVPHRIIPKSVHPSRLIAKASFRNNFDSNIIQSNSNSKAKLLRSLKAKRKREETGLLLVEGHRPIIDAIGRGVLPKLVLYSYRALSAPLGAELSDALFTNSLSDVEEASDSVLDSISDTSTSQGIIAAFEKPSWTSLDSVLRMSGSSSGVNTRGGNLNLDWASSAQQNSSRLVVMLDSISDPGNMGTLIRSCYGFGVDGLVLAGDCCDPWSPKAVRSSMALCLSMPISSLDWMQQSETPSQLHQLLEGMLVAVADGATAGSEEVTAASTSLRYDAVDYTQDVMVVVGSEARGVSEQALRLSSNCQRVYIPMARGLESFNAAVAGSILISEAARQRFHSSSAV